MRKLPFSYALIPYSLLCSVACTSPEAPPSESTSQRSDPIINGYEDTNKENDAVVVILEEVGAGYAGGLCTGALIAKNIVLTARHCVSNTTEYVDCVNDASSDKDPSTLMVRRGWDALANMQGFLSRGKQVFHDHSSSLCGHDLALIVLESDDVTGATPAQPPIVPLKVRVETGPNVSELFSAVGYGLTNPNDTQTAGRRYRRDEVRVLGFEYGTGDADFLGTQSICMGDSGGPAISSNGAVIGVTSRGADCYGNQNVWTRTDRFKFLFDEAVKAAGTTYTGEDGTVYDGTTGTGGTGGSGGGTGGTGGSTSESIIACPDGSCPDGLQCIEAFHGRYCTVACNPAEPVCDPGFQCTELGYCFMNDACSVEEDCAVGTVCVNDNGMYCAPYCALDGACPTGFACAVDQGICYKRKTGTPYDRSASSSGCSVSGNGVGGGTWLATLAGAVLLWSRRRRNRVSAAR